MEALGSPRRRETPRGRCNTAAIHRRRTRTRRRRWAKSDPSYPELRRVTARSTRSLDSRRPNVRRRPPRVPRAPRARSGRRSSARALRGRARRRARSRRNPAVGEDPARRRFPPTANARPPLLESSEARRPKTRRERATLFGVRRPRQRRRPPPPPPRGPSPRGASRGGSRRARARRARCPARRLSVRPRGEEAERRWFRRSRCDRRDRSSAPREMSGARLPSSSRRRRALLLASRACVVCDAAPWRRRRACRPATGAGRDCRATTLVSRWRPRRGPPSRTPARWARAPPKRSPVRNGARRRFGRRKKRRGADALP
mmetsp:Transcript_8988/g.37777  ORF Transcript_8988/g.37777 Transcript_8988/m.37777 type:complete len:316 (+) Transcript_8988:359-1306(+)